MTEIDVWDDRLQLVVPNEVEVWFDQRKLGVIVSEPYEYEGEVRGVLLTLDVPTFQALAPHPLIQAVVSKTTPYKYIDKKFHPRWKRILTRIQRWWWQRRR